jgi:hypothetical protein
MIVNNPESIFRNRDYECECKGKYHDEDCPLAKAITNFYEGLI